ncbi:MAG: hypothetical protein Q4C83_01915 [Candidatus Saccharibacteria bacterium]|nr:hypothetical protein [Candidatus Saccharibacteria bacterium]
MDKEILEHRDYMLTELARLDNAKKDKDYVDKLRDLATYHDMQVRNFQHERLIHLLVSIIFGVIMLSSWAGLLAWLFVTNGYYDEVTGLLIILAIILTILEAAYLRFYYHLENWTQRLYALGTEVYDRIRKF